jgi:hypothetical protein
MTDKVKKQWFKAQKEREKATLDKEERLMAIWDKHPDLSITFDFACGGDSMYDTDVILDNPEDLPKEIKTEIASLVDDIIYERVEFYVNSDGHYNGEAGTVEVEYDKEEQELSWLKSAESEYSETVKSSHKINLLTHGFSKEQIAYLKKNVSGVLCNDWSDDLIYRRDLVLFKEDSRLIERFTEVLKEIRDNGDYYDELSKTGNKEWGNFEPMDEVSVCTNEGYEVSQEHELEIEGETLTFYYQMRGYVFVPSD